MMDNNISELGSLYGQHSRWGVFDTDGIAPTLPAAMGMGGGYVPMLVTEDEIPGEESCELDKNIQKPLTSIPYHDTI